MFPLTCILFVFLSYVSTARAKTTVVDTECGPVWSNLILSTKQGNKYLAFRGIPYAAPPVGPLRFRPPQKHADWVEPRNATTLGSACYQPVTENGIEQRGEYQSFGMSEDCLFVNVYTPDVQPRKPFPVLVFVHGGGFRRGSGNGFGAQNFMDSSPIILVTLNYRLGVFGFLSSGDEVVPGNYGLKDQSAVLRWVQKNIRNFGGDPKSVTLMGQSTGANNVHAHTLSHASKGLFHRAVLLSGNAISLWGYYPPASRQPEYTFNLLLERTKCNMTRRDDSLECLQKLSSNDLEQAEEYFLANGSLPFMFRTVLESSHVSDAFLTDDPRELKYTNPKMPLWIGTVSAEGLFFVAAFLQSNSNVSEFSRTLDDVLPFSLHYRNWLADSHDISAFTQRLEDFYFKNPNNITLADLPSLNDLYGKILFQMPILDKIVSYPGKVYAYYYEHMNAASEYYQIKRKIDTSSLGNFTGALHSDDLISFFGTLQPDDVPLPAADEKISNQMVLYLKNFVHTGNPNCKTLPRWSPVLTKRVEYLYIKDDVEMSSGLTEDPNYRFYHSLPIPWREIPDVLPPSPPPMQDFFPLSTSPIEFPKLVATFRYIIGLLF